MQIPAHVEEESTGSVSSAAAGITEWYDTAAAQVVAFFGRLRRVPIGTWCRMAGDDPHVTAPRSGSEGLPPASDSPGDPLLPEAQADRVARARLRELIEEMPGVARRIHRRIDDEVAVVAGIAPPEMVVRMRRAARLAACAVAARPWLSPEEFERLYRPFAELIPLGSLDTPAPVV